MRIEVIARDWSEPLPSRGVRCSQLRQQTALVTRTPQVAPFCGGAGRGERVVAEYLVVPLDHLVVQLV